MRVVWQHQGVDNDTLLIFFTGWGTTPEVVQHLTLPLGWDYIACYDYREVLPETLPSLVHYRQIFIVAWSMGVWAADLLAPHLPVPTKAIAVNGTPLPMHDLYGIPDDIFRGTLEGLDDENRARFNRRMCGGKALLEVFNSFSRRSTENLRSELLGVYNQVRQLHGFRSPQLPWNTALISEKDRIVPPQNQIRYWQEASIPTRLLTAEGHYPFTSFARWDDLLLK